MTGCDDRLRSGAAKRSPVNHSAICLPISGAVMRGMQDVWNEAETSIACSGMTLFFMTDWA